MNKQQEQSTQTRTKIRQALVRIEQGRPKLISENRKISIIAVAEEAGVSEATIHNRYPDLAERIRGSANKEVRQQRDDKHKVLKGEQEKNKALRVELSELRITLARVTSENATLMLENERLKAITEAPNVTLLNPVNS